MRTTLVLIVAAMMAAVTVPSVTLAELDPPTVEGSETTSTETYTRRYEHGARVLAIQDADTCYTTTALTENPCRWTDWDIHPRSATISFNDLIFATPVFSVWVKSGGLEEWHTCLGSCSVSANNGVFGDFVISIHPANIDPQECVRQGALKCQFPTQGSLTVQFNP